MRLIDADKLYLHLNDWAFATAPTDWDVGEPKSDREVAYNTIQECMKAVDEQPTVMQWHLYPEEKPPRAEYADGDLYLVTTVDSEEVFRALWRDTYWYDGITIHLTDKVTAWVELPKPYERGREI